MKKILNIAKKDLILTLSDTSALVLTLITPFALTLVMIFAFGGSDQDVISSIPVALVNQDESEFAAVLVEVFQSQELSDLVSLTILDDIQNGRDGVDSDTYAALVVIPSEFGKRLSQNRSQVPLSINHDTAQVAEIEIYANPTTPTSVHVVRAIVDEFINRATTRIVGYQVSMTQLINTNHIAGIGLFPADLGSPSSSSNLEIAAKRLISISETDTDGTTSTDFDWSAYMAPSMALLFLMFTMTNGGRSLLSERESGTLQRMLSSPATPIQIIAGKIFGIYLNGVAQLVVLFLASRVFFQIQWGPLPLVIPTILFVVAAATGWGILIAAYTRSAGAANAAGTTVTLSFAIAAGSFIPRHLLPRWLQTASLISPNAWGLEAFNQIRLGTTLVEMLPCWGGMLAMFAVLFLISIFAFHRQFR